MSLTLEDADRIIANGEAERYVKRFAAATLVNAVTANAGGSVRVSDEYFDFALVAARVLVVALQEAGVRQALNLKRRPRGKTYRADAYPSGSPERAIGAGLAAGVISRAQARTALADLMADSGQVPDEKTVDALLDDLVFSAELASLVCADLHRMTGK